MIVLDVNVLVSAFRQDHPHHEVAASWLSHLFEVETVVVPDFVWVGFLRIVTNARIFETPAPIDRAYAFLTALTESEAYLPVAGLESGLVGFKEVLTEAQARGNLISDAYIAAVAISLACPVGTFDRDFRRFTGLGIVAPSAR